MDLIYANAEHTTIKATLAEGEVLDVMPRSPVQDVSDRRFPDAVFLCQDALRDALAKGGSDVNYLCFNKSGHAGSRPRQPSTATSPLLFHVALIVGNRANEKMIWTYTKPNIAMMADKHAVWDRAVRQSPSHAMRQLAVALFNRERAISGRIPARSPKPACRCLLNSTPKPSSRLFVDGVCHESNLH